MKKSFLPMIVGISVLSFASCDSGSTSETTTDSLNSTEATTATETPASTASVDLNASYMDLTSGKTFSIDKDEATGSYVNKETREPVLYYVNVATNDTFDRSGRWVNGAINRLDDGTYNVDDSRLTTKVDEDGDIKVKDHDDTKLKIDGDEEKAKLKTDDSKEKIKGDKYKKKTDSTTTKIKG